MPTNTNQLTYRSSRTIGGGKAEIRGHPVFYTQTEGVYIGDRVAVGVGEAVEGDSVGDLARDDVGVDKPAQQGAVVSCPHVDQTVIVGDDAVSAVVAEDDFRSAGSLISV